MLNKKTNIFSISLHNPHILFHIHISHLQMLELFYFYVSSSISLSTPIYTQKNLSMKTEEILEMSNVCLWRKYVTITVSDQPSILLHCNVPVKKISAEIGTRTGIETTSLGHLQNRHLCTNFSSRKVNVLDQFSKTKFNIPISEMSMCFVLFCFN